MTEQVEIRIPLDDLRIVSFECKKCKSEISVDITNAEARNFRFHDDRLPPRICPCCEEKISVDLQDAFESFFKWVELVRLSKHPVFFRLRKGAISSPT